MLEPWDLFKRDLRAFSLRWGKNQSTWLKDSEKLTSRAGSWRILTQIIERQAESLAVVCEIRTYIC